MPRHVPADGAIVGYLFGRAYTTPALAELTVTPDGHLVGRPRVEGDIGHTIYMGCETDLRANLRRLGIAAGLDQAEWATWGELVRKRIGIDLGGPAAHDTGG
jgi:hypothetical protein